MSEGTDPSSGAQSGGDGVVIPAATRAKHTALVDLIMASESMNDAERQYWIDILPVMNAEQTQQLESILQKERDQLAAIDAKYDKQIEEIAEQRRPIEKIETERRTKASARKKQEAQVSEQEEDSAAEILEKIEEI